MFNHLLIRYGLALLGTAVSVGCKDDGVVGASPFLSLSITRISATIVQGGSEQLTATLTRYGFSGTVDLTVTGTPAGVTASVSDVQTTGAVTTAILTLLVDAAVSPGTYQLAVRGTGSGVSEVMKGFFLTVAVPPSIGISLSAGTGLVWQGNSTWFQANLTRAGGFNGVLDIVITGAPAGVTTDEYYRQTLGTVTTAFISINVDPANAPGEYSLVVHARGSGVSEATATFTLTTTAPDFILTGLSPTLTIVRGAAPVSLTVNVVRANFTGPVTLSVGGDMDEEGSLPTGVTATFLPSPTTGNSSVLAITVGAATVPGVYNLYPGGYTAAGYWCRMLTLTVTAP